MRSALLGAVILAVLLGGVLMLVGGPREGIRAINDARALAALPLRPVGPLLELGEGTPDLVIFMDGDEGWFELDTAALPPATEIGMHGPRLFDAFTGNTHVPLYCWGSTTRPGKIIWVVQAADIARDFAFCNRRRMDLGPLRPYAEPVTLVDADLSESGVDALRQRIAEGTQVAAVTLPSEYQRFTHRRVIAAPFHWYRFGASQSPLPLREAFSNAIIAHLGPLAADANVEVNERVVSFRTDTMGHGDRAATREMGAAIVVDGGTVILPDTAVAQFRITVNCTPTACAALDGFDAAPLLQGFRDTSVLDQALSEALPITQNPDHLMPAPAQLRDAETQLTETAPVTYPVRYIERP